MEDKTIRFLKSHADFQARDARSVFGWRFTPRILFKAGKGTKLVDFITQDIAEIAFLDAHPDFGWFRTGQQFLAYVRGETNDTLRIAARFLRQAGYRPDLPFLHR